MVAEGASEGLPLAAKISLGHHSSIYFSGDRSDFDFYYEVDPENVDEFPKFHVADDFDEEATDGTPEAQFKFSARHWMQPPLRQIKGGQMFVNIEYLDDTGSHYRIDLHWESAVSSRTPGYPYDDAEDRALIRSITVLEEAGGGLSVESDERRETLTAVEAQSSGTPVTWDRDAFGGGLHVSEETTFRNVNSTDPNLPPSKTILVTENSIELDHTTTEFLSGEDPSDPRAHIAKIKWRQRETEFEYQADESSPFDQPSVSTPSQPATWVKYNEKFYRLKKIAYSGSDWDLNGADDEFFFDAQSALKDWSQLEKTKRFVEDSKEVVTKRTLTPGGGGELTLGSTTPFGSSDPFRKSETMFSPGLAEVTHTPEGSAAVTTTKLETLGGYSWSVKSSHTIGSPETKIVYKVYEHGDSDIESTVGTTKSKALIDRFGVLVSSETHESELLVASSKRTNTHASGAPLGYQSLRDGEVDIREYHPHGLPSSYRVRPGAAKQSFTDYDALGRLLKTEDGLGITTIRTYNEGGKIGHTSESVRGGKKIAISNTTYWSNGNLEKSESGRPSRPTVVEGTEGTSNGKVNLTITEGLNTVVQKFGRGGFLEEVGGASVPYTTKRDIQVGSGLCIRRYLSDSPGRSTNTFYDLAGNVSKVEAPGADGNGTAAWDYDYTFAGEDTTVKVDDPDGVFVETKYVNGRFRSVQHEGRAPTTIDFGAGVAGLTTSITGAGRTIGKSSYQPSTGFSQTVPLGIQSLAWNMGTEFNGDFATSTMKGPLGISGESSSKFGLFQSLDVTKNGRAFISKQIRLEKTKTQPADRNEDLTVNRVSATVEGIDTSANFKFEDGTVTSTTHAEKTTTFATTEKSGGTFDANIIINDGARTVGITGTNPKGEFQLADSHGYDFGIGETMYPDGSAISKLTTTATGAETSITENSAGAPVAKSYPADAGNPTESATYSPAGRLLTWKNKRGHIMTYVRDPATKRINGTSWPASLDADSHPGDLTFAYDPATDQIESITNTTDNVTHALGYDGHGRIDSEQIDTAAGDDFDLSRPRNDWGTPTQLDLSVGDLAQPAAMASLVDQGTTPQSFTLATDSGDLADQLSGRIGSSSTGPGGPTWSYSYDPQGVTSPLRDGLGKTTYQDSDAPGAQDVLEVELEYYAPAIPGGDPGNGIDQLNRLKTRTTRFLKVAGQPEISHTFVYDQRGGIETASITQTGSAQLTLPEYATGSGWTYGYSAGMLATAELELAGNTVHDFGYNYDAMGVRTGLNDTGAASVTFAPDPSKRNRIVDIGGAAISYDPDGNRSEDASFGYKWDALNRLRLVRASNASSVEVDMARYRYDYRGRRVEKVLYDIDAPTAATAPVVEKRVEFVYDGWNLAYERTTDGSGTLLRERTYHWGQDIGSVP